MRVPSSSLAVAFRRLEGAAPGLERPRLIAAQQACYTITSRHVHARVFGISVCRMYGPDSEYCPLALSLAPTSQARGYRSRVPESITHTSQAWVSRVPESITRPARPRPVDTRLQYEARSRVPASHLLASPSFPFVCWLQDVVHRLVWPSPPLLSLPPYTDRVPIASASTAICNSGHRLDVTCVHWAPWAHIKLNVKWHICSRAINKQHR